MRMTTLYAALCGAFLLGSAAISQAQTNNAPAGSSVTNPVKNANVAMSRTIAPTRNVSKPITKRRRPAASP